MFFPYRLEGLRLSNIAVCSLARHVNKIKLGHLGGNRFVIRVREPAATPDEALKRARNILAVLQRRGTPNYFGPQRFGNRKDSHELGYLMIKGRIEPFMDLFLGQAKPDDSPPVAQARRYYDQGQYPASLKSWPYPMRDHRRMLQMLMKVKGDKKKAYNRMDTFLKRFMMASYQSFVFNLVLADRLQNLDTILDGDVAWKHRNGACFRVEDVVAEQPRCDDFEISPTGPIIGYRMTEPSGQAAKIESSVLDALDLTEHDFRQMVDHGVRGGRRPLRFQPRQLSVQTGRDHLGNYLELGFVLDPGCYATVLLGEILKISDELP